jgi:hypothetical protein
MDKNINFEIGNWVSCEDGIGQLIYIREFHVEPFVELNSYDEVDEKGVYHRLYGVKLLCDFEGKLKKRHSLKFYVSSRLLKKQYKDFVEEIKTKTPEAYERYMVYDQKDESEYDFTLKYYVEKKSETKYISLVDDVCYNLLPHFTFKEFKKEFKKQCTEIKIEDFIKENDFVGRDNMDELNILSIVFYSRNYKVVNKERIFSGVRGFINNSSEE